MDQDNLMSSEKQIAANRLNAQKSTGPKTPEGRAAVRLNGVKHGLFAQTLVLPGESESDFTALLESYEAEHAPATPTEEDLVVQAAMAMWRLRRLYHAEAAFLARERKSQAEWHSKTKLDDHTLTGMAINSNKDTVSTFRRQEAALERTYHRALHELERVRSRRTKMALVSPPASAAQPEAPPQPEINDVQTPATDPAPLNLAPDPAPSPDDTIHLVPPPEDMQ
jgi:hypothetical protein